MKDEPMDRLGQDGFYAERMVSYATLYPRLREVARQQGYALALHGSLVKDLDVIAVPWTEEAVPPDELIKALVECVGGMLEPGGLTKRLHNRWAATIRLVGIAGYIDLSVMPLGLSEARARRWWVEDHTCSRRSTCGTRRLTWRVPDLWAAAADLPVREVQVFDLDHLLETWHWGPLESLRDFAQHMERVMDADLSWPIILSQEGELMDGAHRLVKAHIQGAVVRVVRFDHDPNPWRDEDVEAPCRQPGHPV